MNYYELFDISPSLQIDLKALRRSYLKLSRTFHPDNFANGTAGEQNYAVQQTEEINKAYQILNDEKKHLNYHLQWKEFIIADEKYQLNQAFLMDMMELNEEMMDLKVDQNSSRMAELQVSLEVQKKELYESIVNQLQADIPNRTLIKDAYYQLKYLDRLLGQGVE